MYLAFCICVQSVVVGLRKAQIDTGVAGEYNCKPFFGTHKSYHSRTRTYLYHSVWPEMLAVKVSH